jgi:hypothetical protein
MSADVRTPSRMVFAVLGGAALLIGGLAIALAPRPAAAKPEFAAQTKKPCGFCHQNPGGGGPLTGNGTKFKANGFKL